MIKAAKCFYSIAYKHIGSEEIYNAQEVMNQKVLLNLNKLMVQ